MDALILHLEAELEKFLAVSKAENVMLYLPYCGEDLVVFLDSCFHRTFLELLESRSFTEKAVFTEEKSREGRLFVLLSRDYSKDFDDFNFENSEALQASPVFKEAFGRSSSDNTTNFACYVPSSNTIFLRQNNFYSPGRIDMRQYGDETGAEVLAIYQAVKQGYYSLQTREFQSSPVAHVCNNHSWCDGTRSIFKSGNFPHWHDLFPPPWDRPYIGVQDLFPYRILNVLRSEFDYQNDSHATSSLRNYPMPSRQINVRQTGDPLGKPGLKGPEEGLQPLISHQKNTTNIITRGAAEAKPSPHNNFPWSHAPDKTPSNLGSVLRNSQPNSERQIKGGLELKVPIKIHRASLSPTALANLMKNDYNDSFINKYTDATDSASQTSSEITHGENSTSEHVELFSSSDHHGGFPWEGIRDSLLSDGTVNKTRDKQENDHRKQKRKDYQKRRRARKKEKSRDEVAQEPSEPPT